MNHNQIIKCSFYTTLGVILLMAVGFIYGVYSFSAIAQAAEPLVELRNASDTVINSFTTIQACTNAMQSGQICLVYPGTYNERVSVSNSNGSASSLKTIKAQQSRTVTTRGFSIGSYVRVEGFN